MLKVQRAIHHDPRAWTQAFNDHMAREVGAEDTGGSWTAAEYARRRINFGKMHDVRHAYFMMAELHRLLHRRDVDHAEAFLAQCLKGLEQVTLDNGDWSLGWALTGLPEIDVTRNRRGGAHPVEMAAGMAYLKELKTMEEWRSSGQRGGGGGGRNKNLTGDP